MDNRQINERIIEWCGRPISSIEDVIFALTMDRELRGAFLGALADSVEVLQSAMRDSCTCEPLTSNGG